MKLLSIKYSATHVKAIGPYRATLGASGYDLTAVDHIVIQPGCVEIIDTYVIFEIPPGFEGQVRPRSSMGRNKVILVNSIGTIDSDYRGTVKLQYLNLSNIPYVIEPGDRIGQIVFCEISSPALVHVDETELRVTERGKGGFGSTGK